MIIEIIIINAFKCFPIIDDIVVRESELYKKYFYIRISGVDFNL